MSFEIFEKLGAKVQQALETITRLQRELEEAREQNRILQEQSQEVFNSRDALIRENEQLKREQFQWQERLQILLDKMDEV